MIRTIDQLIEKIAEELVWRRKELVELRALVQESTNGLRSRVVIRAAIALLYAHWEGFVKKVSAYYLEYVASHRLLYKDLAPNFVALILKAKFAELAVSKKISGGNLLADFMCTSLDKRANLPYKNVIDTQSNLSSKVLLDILCALGLDDAQFSTRLNFIDANLVNPRNHIAHGEDFFLSVDEYLQLHDDVNALIEVFRNEIENSSVLTRYARAI